MVSGIEDALSRTFPEDARGERKSLMEEIRKWAEGFAEEADANLSESEEEHHVEVFQKDYPVRRTVLTLRGRRTYTIVIHDPVRGGGGLPAESISGADYALEFPVSYGSDKLLVVQLKRRDYGMKPKQYFGMGAFYMYALYLQGLQGQWMWGERFRSGAEYVTRRKNPLHSEFLFVKIVEDDMYIPLSSILRTFCSRGTMKAVPDPPDTQRVQSSEQGTLAELSDVSQHLSTPYYGLYSFMEAAESCSIGIIHPSSRATIERKSGTLFAVSAMLMQPNVLIIETL